MFENIGGKIKNLAVVVTWIGIAGSCLSGFITMGTSFIAGLLIIVVGSLSSWLGSFLLYGFGQLIENSEIIAENSAIMMAQDPAPRPAAPAYPPVYAPTYAPVPTAAPAYTPAPAAAPAHNPVGPSGTIPCPKCGTYQKSDRLFCFECGTDLHAPQAEEGKWTCKNCGTLNSNNYFQCKRCASQR